MNWQKFSSTHIKQRVFEALAGNTNYRSEAVLGIPATFLDSAIFYEDAPFLKDAPFLSTLIANPNHIGVHTLGEDHEEFFSGTQQLEKDLISICAEEIFGAEKDSCDGYVASGGTEGNIEALWMYRNYFMKEHKAQSKEIAVVYSIDTHYSIPKGMNLLGLRGIALEVDENSRQIRIGDLEQKVEKALASGVNYFIVNMNLGTTMFGSVDDIDRVTDFFNLLKLNYKLHVDGAYGGFIYPFTQPQNPYSFKNKNISSFSLDGHKLLQAPYGTGIFLCRKGLLDYVCTDEAGYVKGKDFTLCGSRSGANAVAVWMILRIHGSNGWNVKMHQLIDRTNLICEKLQEWNLRHYRHPNMNIVTIHAGSISPVLARKYHLVPDTHQGQATWYKIVVMEHLTQGIIDAFMADLRAESLVRS
jgi:tyrosine decarboxylase/aspartate 1-decarboxylase